jgi:uncharacterized protein (UPF0276 family)
VIQLTADLSAALINLILEEPGIIDGIEVGPWYRLDEIDWYRQSMPEVPFFFHGADLIHPVGVLPGAMAKIQASMQSSGSPWVSLHLSAWLPLWLRKMIINGWPTPRPEPVLDAHRLVWQARRVARVLDRPVLLENVDPLPWPGYTYYAEPAWISDVLARTGCGLLLDIGHARVAAAQLGVQAVDYLSQLPLERVTQIHLSGPREKNGRLFDAHEPLQEEDYRLFDFILSISNPQVVTLEYIREPEALREQILRLRGRLC